MIEPARQGSRFNSTQTGLQPTHLTSWREKPESQVGMKEAGVMRFFRVALLRTRDSVRGCFNVGERLVVGFKK